MGPRIDMFYGPLQVPIPHSFRNLPMQAQKTRQASEMVPLRDLNSCRWYTVNLFRVGPPRNGQIHNTQAQLWMLPRLSCRHKSYNPQVSALLRPQNRAIRTRGANR